jgi:hypothetical protein
MIEGEVLISMDSLLRYNASTQVLINAVIGEVKSLVSDYANLWMHTAVENQCASAGAGVPSDQVSTGIMSSVIGAPEP